MENSQNNNLSSSGKYDFVIQGLFSFLSIGLGIFLLMQHRFDFWALRPIGIFCLFFPALLTVGYLRKNYKFEQERSIFLDKVLGSSPNVIFVFDWKTAKVYALNGGFPTLGISQDQIADSDENIFYKISTPEDFQKIMSSLEKTANGSGTDVDHSEWSLRAADRSQRTFRVGHTVLSKDESSTLIICFAEDITRHKYTEKYAAMQDLGATIAHEIATPLQLISMQIENLAESSDGTHVEKEKVDKSIERIDKSVKRINRTIQALRTLTQGDSQDSSGDFSAKVLMDDIQSIWQQRLESRGIKVILACPTEDLPLRANRSQITSALFNVISFCFHQILNAKQREGSISVTAAAIGGYMEFIISDSVKSGDHLHHVFDPTKINLVGENIGLSMSFSKGIVQKHGGDLYVDKSFPETRFILKIPLEIQEKLAA